MLSQARFASGPTLQSDLYPFSSLAKRKVVEMNVAIGRNGPSRLVAGTTCSPGGVYVRPPSSSHAASPSRTCLGSRFASIRVKQQGDCQKFRV